MFGEKALLEVLTYKNSDSHRGVWIVTWKEVMEW